jgi:hypothetical protein
MDMYAVLEKIAVPRPNHSEAVDGTAAFIRDLLSSWDIPFTVQEFVLRPYQQLLVGYACFLLSLLILFFVIKRKPLPIIIAAVAIPVLLFMEFEFFIPLVSPLITKTGQNIIVSFPAADAARELIFAAHYDSKTDFFDHIERARVYRYIPIAGVLGMLMSLWVLLRNKISSLRKPALSIATVCLAVVLSAYWGLVALGFGGYIFLSGQSCGAVDNGGSVVTLLALAKDIREGKVRNRKIDGHHRVLRRRGGGASGFVPFREEAHRGRRRETRRARFARQPGTGRPEREHAVLEEKRHLPLVPGNGCGAS